MSTNSGLKPKHRRTLATKNANQWHNTPQQNKFMVAWLDPTSETFGNAYQSALKVGYNERYATQIASPAINNKWVQDYKRLSKLEIEHIEQKLIGMINGRITREQSNSPEDTRLKAMELLGKFTGKLNDKHQTTVNIVQPILNSSSVKGEIIPEQR